MRRRDFLATGVAAITSTAAPMALGQEPAADPASGGFEIPGFGRVSLDPADYDADTIARLFATDFGGATERVRSYYGDAVRAISSRDTQQMAKLAGPLIQQASKAAALPFIGKGLKESLMTPPAERLVVQKGADSIKNGPPVYYVNGIFTPKQVAANEAKELAKQLPGRRIELLYNEGTDPNANQQLAGKDLEEAYRDRVWPVYLTGLLSGKSLGAGLQAALGGDSPLQHNPTTRNLAYLLHEHATKQPAKPVALVGYSQGSMIVRNALFTLALLGKQAFVEQRVAFVAPGLPINDQEVWPVPKKFTPIIDPQDPVPAYLGLQGKGLETKNALVKHHGWFDDGYAKQIKPAMLTL